MSPRTSGAGSSRRTASIGVGAKLLYDQLFLNERHPGYLLPYWALDAERDRDYLELRRAEVSDRLAPEQDQRLAKLRWQYRRLRRQLVGDRSIRIVHLRRRNLLAAHLSTVKATRYEWVGRPAPARALRLAPEPLRRSIRCTRRLERVFRSAFRGHPCCEVSYEEPADAGLFLD